MTPDALPITSTRDCQHWKSKYALSDTPEFHDPDCSTRLVMLWQHCLSFWKNSAYSLFTSYGNERNPAEILTDSSKPCVGSIIGFGSIISGSKAPRRTAWTASKFTKFWPAV